MSPPVVAEQLLLSSREPSRWQVQVVLALGAAVLLALLASLPFRLTPLARIDSFIPVVDTILLFSDVLTGTLLLSQAAVLRSRALVALGTGYFFAGFIIIPHALTFPGAFSATGLLGAGVNTTIWLYFFWHTGLPVAVIAYALFKRFDAPLLKPAAVRPVIFGCVCGAAVLTIALTLLATVGEPWLPAMMTDSIQWLPNRVAWVAGFLVLLLAVAMAAVIGGRRSVLDIWLLVALWAWLLELGLVLSTSTRFSGGWYAGRTAGLLSGVLVLLMLLSETNKSYARFALSLAAQRRERESRLLTVNAVAASIAHEIKQPLTSIMADAQAGSIILRRLSSTDDDLPEIFSSIAAGSARVAEVVESIRAMFTHRRGEMSRIDINDLLRETTTMVSSELTDHHVVLQLALDAELRPVTADRVQIQHVFLNLFVNAIEAMADVDGRQRWLAVRSGTADAYSVLISVEDSGRGIDAAVIDRIFEPFVSTKQNGTGMGLPLCRSIVESHGGRLWAVPRQLGAAFHVQLPHDGQLTANE